MWYDENSKIVVMQNPPYAGNNMYFTTEENYNKLGTREFNPRLTEGIPWDESVETFGLVRRFLVKIYNFKPENIINKTRI
jgi:hypothetical protein